MFEWSIGFTYSQLLVSGVCLSQVNKRDLVSTGRVFLTPIGVYMNVVPITDNLFGYNSWLDVNRIESIPTHRNSFPSSIVFPLV